MNEYHPFGVKSSELTAVHIDSKVVTGDVDVSPPASLIKVTCAAVKEAVLPPDG